MKLRATALAVPMIAVARFAAADPAAPTPPAAVPPAVASSKPAVAPPLGPPPNMEPGLWEWTIVQKTNSSTLTPAQIAKLPADLRARVIAGQERAKAPHTLDACLTADTLRHGFTLQHDNHRACTKQVNASSPSFIDENVECHGQADIMKSHIIMKVIDRHTTDGTLELQRLITVNGDHQIATGHIAGKFQTADCGYTKP